MLRPRFSSLKLMEIRSDDTKLGCYSILLLLFARLQQEQASQSTTTTTTITLPPPSSSLLLVYIFKSYVHTTIICVNVTRSEKSSCRPSSILIRLLFLAIGECYCL
ncbi:hypothetical protein M0804_012176 [Polistes exclamans]|nr:hypothetical protein M0804_012176 [Polistes exclamans]